MKKFSQFVLFLGVAAVPIFKHWGPRQIPQNGIPVVVEKVEDPEVIREARTTESIFESFNCGVEELPLRTARAARHNHISARLVAAVVVTESSCNPRAVSKKGAVGLMGVNSRVWKKYQNLTDPESNLNAGTEILASYIQAYGIKEGLHRYNGLGDPTDTYSTKILQIARR